MATARIVQLQVAPAALITSEVWTHFNLQHRVTGASSWTAFFTTGATLEDLDVALLTAGLYTLDGINSPTGNEPLASEAGTEYRSRGKTAGGYGNWSEPFKAIYEPDDDGPLGDVGRLERDMADITTMLGFANQEEADFFLAGCLNDAMDEVRETDALDDYYTGASTASAGTQRKLASIELLFAKSFVIEKAMDMKATGMHEPLLVEDSQELQERAEYYRNRALAKMATLAGSNADVAGSTPFAMPAVSSSTFTHLESHRTPYERNELLDETSDAIAASDLDNG